jgi:uncharacterized protein (TIGR02118 family)
MFKLIILIEPPQDQQAFEEAWPRFLHEAERMPGLQQEATVRIVDTLFGEPRFSKIHELFFNPREDLQAAMISPSGQATGQILQQITTGRMSLLIAEHREDSIENLRKYHDPDPDPS